MVGDQRRGWVCGCERGAWTLGLGLLRASELPHFVQVHHCSRGMCRRKCAAPKSKGTQPRLARHTCKFKPTSDSIVRPGARVCARVSVLTNAYQLPGNGHPRCPTGHQVGVRWRAPACGCPLQQARRVSAWRARVAMALGSQSLPGTGGGAALVACCACVCGHLGACVDWGREGGSGVGARCCRPA